SREEIRYPRAGRDDEVTDTHTGVQIGPAPRGETLPSGMPAVGWNEGDEASDGDATDHAPPVAPGPPPPRPGPAPRLPPRPQGVPKPLVAVAPKLGAVRVQGGSAFPPPLNRAAHADALR